MTDHTLDDQATRDRLATLRNLTDDLLEPIDAEPEQTTTETLHAQLRAAQAYARTLRDELALAQVSHQPAPSEWLQSDAWRELREAALARFGRRCAICNSDHHVDAHHRTYERYGGDELLDDLTALCRGCHELFSKLGRLAGGSCADWTKERFLS